MQEIKFLTVNQLAEKLQVSLWRAHEICRQVLPPGIAVKIGRSTRINSAALNEWLAKGGSLARSNEVRNAAA